MKSKEKQMNNAEKMQRIPELTKELADFAFKLADKDAIFGQFLLHNAYNYVSSQVMPSLYNQMVAGVAMNKNKEVGMYD